MIRTAILYDERNRLLGKTSVADATFVIRHLGRFFFRTAEGVRLSGGGVGVRFLEVEPLVRDKLEPV